ncbi:hypothetical protein [Burkholderia perseverans]|uniref:hypothetical protein n=1 Tax=Burkholderia perseverans TaxID=2615214 RepID=UPI001FEF5DEE|nr:hypothetical protein [Burkholderia perseverans]
MRRDSVSWRVFRSDNASLLHSRAAGKVMVFSILPRLLQAISNLEAAGKPAAFPGADSSRRMVNALS